MTDEIIKKASSLMDAVSDLRAPTETHVNELIENSKKGIDNREQMSLTREKIKDILANIKLMKDITRD